MPKISSYRPRHFSFDGIWSTEETTFKAYLVTAGPDIRLSNEMIENAKLYIDLAFPAMRQQEGNDHGLGYVIFHKGDMRNWLLIHWWAYEHIALQMMASAELGKTEFKSVDHRPFHACVWEQVVINHEKDAWVASMMAPTGNQQSYLENRLPNGAY